MIGSNRTLSVFLSFVLTIATVVFVMGLLDEPIKVASPKEEVVTYDTMLAPNGDTVIVIQGSRITPTDTLTP